MKLEKCDLLINVKEKQDYRQETLLPSFIAKKFSKKESIGVLIILLYNNALPHTANIFKEAVNEILLLHSPYSLN